MSGARFYTGDVAEATSVARHTIITYIYRGSIPPADGTDEHGRWWYSSTIDEWRARHQGPRRPAPLAERFWAKVAKAGPDECWLWTASCSLNGYGQISLGGRPAKILRAHRVAYELAVGPIPPGLQIDHLCRNRRCVNPAHLEPVDGRTNKLRSPYTVTSIHAEKTHCAHGHEFTPENTHYYRGVRVCRICLKRRNDISNARRRSA